MSVSDINSLKSQFIFVVKVIIQMEEIPSDLVINWDQTGIHYVLVSSWTMAKSESRSQALTTKVRSRLFLKHNEWLATFYLYN